MAEYTSQYTGLQIDEALTSALNVKRVRGLIKMTDDGPVAAIPGEDFPDGSGSTVSVTGLLKGVLNEDTNEIEVQQAKAGEDYQTPLTAGVDYAIPSSVINKQNKITAQGLLKGLGDGSVAEAVPGEDYQSPIPAGTYATPSKGVTVTLPAAGWSDNTQVINVSGYNTSERNFIAPDYASIPEYAACGIRAIESMGAITFTCDTVPENDLTINVAMGV